MTQLQATQFDLDDLKRLAEQLLDEAKRQGATGAETDISVDSGLSVTARLGDVETLEHHKDQDVAVVVYFGTRRGSSSSSDLTTEAL
jgi:PmbA protein